MPGSDPLVSVIVPTHNRREILLDRALPAIAAQTYPFIETVVAAHGCTDGTEIAVHARYPGVRVLRVPKTARYPDTPENRWFAGPVEPLNAALNAVRGVWVARIDDDDIWTPDHIETLLRFAQAGDYEFVSSAHETHEGMVAPYCLDGVLVGGCQTWLYRSYLGFMKYNPDCWRKSWDRVNDTDLQQRFRRAGVRMGYLGKSTAKVLPRPGEAEVGLRAYTNPAGHR